MLHIAPTWEDKAFGVQLYLADCMDVLPTLGTVDAVVTDPPYSAHTHAMARTSKGRGHVTKLVPFKALSGEQFDEVVNECIGVSNGWVIMTCDYRNAARFYDHKRFVRLGAWVKPNPMPQISADRPGQGFETILCLHSGKTKKVWNRGGGAGVWIVPVQCCAEVPTQKPLKLVSSLISDFTQTRETVLDPFMGSGTTGIAAIQLNRQFIGIEREPKYFEIAVRRISEAIVNKQGGVLCAKHTPEQLNLFGAQHA